MLIVTIAALVMAASLGWFAYSLMQEEQRRSEARVALLTAALQGDGAGAFDAPARISGGGFAPVATQPLTGAAWSRGHEQTPELVYLEDDSRPARWFRSEHAQEAEPRAASAVDAALADAPVVEPQRTTLGAAADSEVTTRAAGLFADVPEARPADARGVIALAGLVVVGVLALGYVWFGRPATGAPAAVGVPTTSTAAASSTTVQGGVPLELLTLSHEQRGSALVVRGMVRNPVSGSDRTGLVASVMLLDQAGGLLGSGRAPIGLARLRPGDSTGFSVEVPSHKDVRRYRVTFRGVDGGLVAHADRRAARP
jgi:hypothetical protein